MHVCKLKYVLCTFVQYYLGCTQDTPSHISVSLEGQFLHWGIVSTSPNPQAGGPHLVSHLRLLIKYIWSYLMYWMPFIHPQPEDVPCCGDGPTYGFFKYGGQKCNNYWNMWTPTNGKQDVGSLCTGSCYVRMFLWCKLSDEIISSSFEVTVISLKPAQC